MTEETGEHMNDEIRSLLDSLRRGQYEDPAEKASLLAAALREEGDAALATILSLLLAPQAPLRLAGVEACIGQKDTKLQEALCRLAEDSDVRVRTKLAEHLDLLPRERFLAIVQTLARDSEGAVRTAVAKASAGKPACLGLQQSLLAGDSDWTVRVAAANALAAQPVPAVVGSLFTALACDSDSDVQRACAEGLERKLSSAKAPAEKSLPSDISVVSKAGLALKEIGVERFPLLTEWLDARTSVEVDPRQLERFGTDLTAQALSGLLPRGYEMSAPVQKLVDLIQRAGGRRSIALLGESGVGKTALVNELVYELAKPGNGGWRVLRVSPTDFMTGTRYIGEWETKLKELIDACSRPRHVLIYVPNLRDLSSVGRWSKSDSNVADALAPYLEEGTVLLLGESTPSEFVRGLGGIQSLQRLFEKVRLESASEAETANVLRAMVRDAGATASDTVLNQLQELSSYFNGHLARPGQAACVLSATLNAQTDRSKPIEFRDVLATFSRSTGLPVDLLDDTTALNLTGVREFFDKRIIGQSEAVQAVVDLIALVKAGLTDPGKPIGVFLFTGPTGVGKTELARALAEYIFGDVGRLLRFDMSEFASDAGFERLIGARNERGLLTDAVRERPFSVVLLDEIEKSHVNVFDLCLQVFDAGRLTDGKGRTVDFRRTIVILTSNIGSSVPTPQLGFGQGPALPAEPDAERTMRELARCFRPEFLNRIDRIVHFHPLSLDTAEQIARREVNTVLRRSGIIRRQVTVDVAPEVLARLVKEGYSPHFGARPLKRTVERLILLPVARSIAGGRLAPGAALSLQVRDDKIETHITPPPDAPAPSSVSKAVCRKATDANREIARQLRAALETIEPRILVLSQRKSDLLASTQESGFYKNARLRDATFDEIHKLDQFFALQEGWRKALEQIENKLEHGPLPPLDEAALSTRLDRLQAELDQIRFVAQCRDARELSDALLCLSRVDHQGTPLSGVETLIRMYQGLADRRRLGQEVLAECHDGACDSAFLQVSGLGAYAMLRGETGLHEMLCRRRERQRRTGRETTLEDREVVRVDVFPMGGEPDRTFLARLKERVQALEPARERLLAKAEIAVRLFDEETARSFDAWFAGPKADALDRARRILFAQVPSSPDVAASRAASIGVIRLYQRGIDPKVRDLRSGRSTTLIDRVFKGALDPFLLPRDTTGPQT